MVTKQTDPKDDPTYLFKTPVEEIIFFGETEQDKISNALAFSRLRGIVQRFGQQITPDEFDTLKACMQTCISEEP